MSASIIRSSYISEHRYFTARQDAYQLASGKIVDPYFLVEMPPSVTAMAVTENNEVILIRQYRHPIGQDCLELPGGFIEPEEDPAVAVKRELMEETGYQFKDVIHLQTTAANPGVLNNFTHLFLLTGGVVAAQQQLDENEEIEILLTPISEVVSLLQEGKIVQSMHALCVFYALQALRRLEIIQ